MPATSKSQRRLMAAAEHGATFPLAQQLRSSMTLGQLHDFAATPEKGLPQHVKTLHPKMQERAQMVKEAHTHLQAAVPEYRQATPRQRMMMTQEHIRTRKGR